MFVYWQPSEPEKPDCEPAAVATVTNNQTVTVTESEYGGILIVIEQENTSGGSHNRQTVSIKY